MHDAIEQQRQHFEKISSLYIKSRAHPNQLLLKDLIWSNFFSNLKITLPFEVNVLEPMCGFGEGLEILKKNLNKNVVYSGFDYSVAMVEHGKALNPELKIEIGDVTKYVATKNQFHLIILIGGLHHIFTKAQDSVERLTFSLIPNGYFLSFEPTHNCWLTQKIRNFIYKKNSIFDEETEQGFDKNKLDQIFLNCGYSKIKQVNAGLLSYILYYNPDAFPKLNAGGLWAVKFTYLLDKFFGNTWLANKLSFSTITLWQKK